MTADLRQTKDPVPLARTDRADRVLHAHGVPDARGYQRAARGGHGVHRGRGGSPGRGGDGRTAVHRRAGALSRSRSYSWLTPHHAGFARGRAGWQGQRDFCDRWQHGIDNPHKDGQEVAKRIGESATTYLGTKQRNAEVSRPRVAGGAEPWPNSTPRPTPRFSSPASRPRCSRPSTASCATATTW